MSRHDNGACVRIYGAQVQVQNATIIACAPIFRSINALHSRRPRTLQRIHILHFSWIILNAHNAAIFVANKFLETVFRLSAVHILESFCHRRVHKYIFYCRGFHAEFRHKSSIWMPYKKRQERNNCFEIMPNNIFLYVFVYRECDIPENPNCSTHKTICYFLGLLTMTIWACFDRSIRTKMFKLNGQRSTKERPEWDGRTNLKHEISCFVLWASIDIECSHMLKYYYMCRYLC